MHGLLGERAARKPFPLSCPSYQPGGESRDLGLSDTLSPTCCPFLCLGLEEHRGGRFFILFYWLFEIGCLSVVLAGFELTRDPPIFASQTLKACTTMSDCGGDDVGGRLNFHSG